MDRETMLDEIKFTFKGVTREGGVSWSEARVIDDHGSKEERMAARAKDTDKNWLEVANDPTWTFDAGVGGHVFLDPIGYRYYLAAAMTAELLLHPTNSWALESSLSNDPSFISKDKYAKLDERQRVCVKHFIKHMIQITSNKGPDFYWKRAYNAYWKQIPEVPMRTPRSKPKKESKSKS